MDFSLNEDERLFQESLREFLKGEMAPLADERDKIGPLTKEESLQILKKFQSVGISLDPEGLRMLIGNPVFFCVFCEEVGRVWPSLSPLLGMGAIPAMFVPFSSDGTRERLMPKLERAEFLGCFAETEPGAGCDTTSLKTTARLVGDVYIVNGTKTWISNAPIADVAFIGVHDTQTGTPTFLLAERDVSPWTTNELHKIGWKASPTGEMYLEDVKVPK
jgi:glutaryl-CoA dehydrogenase (non-decarboxylating)